MKYVSHILFSIAALIVAVTLSALFFRNCEKRNDKITITETRDTVVRVDTIKIEDPLLVYNYEKGVLFIQIDDSTYYPIPVSQYYYAGDNYQAWVSGYEASLDSLMIYEKNTEITRTIDKSVEYHTKYGLLAGAELGSNFNGHFSFAPYLGVEVNRHSILVGFDVVNKEGRITYLYKFWKK